MIDNISSKFNAKKSDCTLQFSNYNSGIYSEFTERVIACEALQFILDYFNLMKSLILVNKNKNNLLFFYFSD